MIAQHDYPYRDYPYELDKGERPASVSKATPHPGGWHLRPMVLCIWLFLRISPFWTLAWLVTRAVVPYSFFHPVALFCFATLTWLARQLFQLFFDLYIMQKKAGSTDSIPLYLVILFWICFLPGLTWFDTLYRALRFTSSPAFYSLLLLFIQGLLLFRNYHLGGHLITPR
jgi:hypothetical protein